MALKVADRVRENTSSTGVGGISFTGSPAGFQTFSSVLTSGDITYYTIEENDKWEIGIGTYGSDNLERNYILGSSNSGNKISLGGSGTVFITYPAEKSVYRNQESQAIVGASGLVFDNGTIIKDAKITELYDVNVSGTPASTHLLSFDVTNKGLLIGDSTGPSNNGNILIGHGAGSSATSANQSVIIGTEAAVKNQTGSQNVHIGYQSGPVAAGSSSVVYHAVSVGYQAGHKMRHNSTAIGHQAGIDAYEIGFVAMGYQAASGIGSYSVAVGMEAGKSYNDDYATIIGYQAGYNGGGVDSIWVGRGAGHSSAGAARSVGIGKEAGKSSTANDSIYIGKSAGQSNTGNDLLFIGNASPAAMGTLIKGDMDSKRLAVGNADITLSDTFHVGINTATDKGVVIKSAAAQSADLTQWVNASDGILASVSNSGIVSANGLMASGAGLQVADNTPVVTANTLYSVGGGLYWNGSPLAGGGGTVTPAQLEYVSGIAVYASGEVGSGDVTTDQLNYVSGIAVYSSGQAIANEADIATNVTNISANVTDIVATSGIAAYASGNSITNESDISTNTTNIATNAADIVTASGALRTSINTNTTNISTNATDIVATSGIANYASGQAIANEGDIVATSGIANYASGQAIANETDIATNVSNISTNTSNISTNTSNISTNTSNISTNTTNITSATNTANYASGQAIDNEGDIVAVSGIAAYASGHAHDDLYVSGVAAYASGNTSNIAFGSNVEGDILYHDGTSFTRLPKGTDSHVLTMDGNVPAWEAATGGGGDVTTAQLVYVSGIAVYGSGQAESLNYASGVAAYASGNSLTNATNIATNAADIVTASGALRTSINTNASNISTNTTNITAATSTANYASGQALSLTYASGLTATNASNISTNTSNISTNTTNITAVTNTANYASGEALSLTYASGLTATNASNITTNASDIVAVSGIAHYASGHAHDDLYVSGVAAYASGQAIDNETDIATNASNISTNTTNITSNTNIATYASGQVNVTTDGTAEASKALILDANKSFSGVKNGRLNQFDSWLYSSGVNVGNSGVVLSSSTPSDTDNTLYNVAGTLYFNGTQLASAGGASPTAQYASGEALSLTYASGLTATNASNISTNTTNITAATNTANYASGQALSLTYASGLTATNASNISTNTTNITAATNTANYASGQALSLTYASGLTATNAANISTNTTNITAATNTANYASGQALSLTYASGLTATNASNISTNTTNITAATNTANYASGEALSLNYASGVAAYASGNTANITFGSNAEGDILYHDGSTFTRLAKGTDNHVLTMNGNVPNWEAATSSTTNASGAIYQVQYNADGANFGADPAFIFAKNNAAFTNPYVLAVSGTIIANTGDANYANPISIGSGAYIGADDAIAIGKSAYVVSDLGIAMGSGARVISGKGIAIGTNASSQNDNICIGENAGAELGISIGHNVYCAYDGIGIGGNSDAHDGSVNIGGNPTHRRNAILGRGATGASWQDTVGIGYQINAGSTNTTGNWSTIVGTKAAYIAGYDSSYACVFGGQASAEYGSVAIGYEANAAGPFAVGLGYKVVAPEKHFVVASGAAQTSVMLSGVFGSHLSLPNGQQFRQIASAAQTTDLMQWQNSAGTNVASMTPSGVLNVYDIRTSGNDVTLGDGAVNTYPAAPTVYSVTIGKNAESKTTLDVVIGVNAEGDGGGNGTVAIGNTAKTNSQRTVAIGNYSKGWAAQATAVGASAEAEGYGSVAIGFNTEAKYSTATAMGNEALARANSATAIGAGAVVDGLNATALGGYTDAIGERSVAIGWKAQAHGTSWVIASGDTSAEVGISGVFGSYVAIPNDQKLAVGGNVPTYTVDALGHGAMVRATGVIVGNSGIVLSDNVPSVTDYTLYRDGSDLKWNGSAIGGSATAAGAIHQIQYNSDGTNFGADAQFLFAKNNAAFTNDRVLVVSGTIIANSGDANYASPVSIGSGAYVTNYSTVAIGDRAAAKNTMAIAIGRLASSEGVSSIAIGDQATAASASHSTIAIGESANASANRAVAIGKSSSAGQESLAVGTSSDANALYTTAVGYNADAGAKSAVAVGNAAIAAERSVALGMMAKAGYHGVALGQAAIAPEGGFVVASGAALTDVLLSGVMKDHLTMPNGQQFRQIATAAQTSDLMQWQNSAGTNVAAMTPSGILNAYDIRTSGTEVVLGQGATSTQANGVAIGLDAENKSARGVAIGYNASTFNTSTVSYAGVAIGSNATTTNGISVSIGVNATSVAEGVALGGGANAGSFSTAIGKGAITYHGGETRASLAIGYDSQAYGKGAVAVGGKDPNGTKAVGFGSLALGYGAEAGNANSDRSVAIGCEAKAYGTAWVIASGATAAEVGISGVFGSYVAIPNDQKLAVGGNVPTYTVDALGHGAMVRATGVIVGNSGIVLSDNVPAVTDYTLYRDGSDLKWNGSAIGGSSLTAGSGIAIVDNKVHFESKSSGGTVLSSIKRDNDTHVTLLVSGTIVSNAADAARPSCVSIGSGSYISPTYSANYGNSVAVGALAAVTGGSYGGGTAIGSHSLAYQYAVAVGHAAKTSHVYGTAIGYHADARNGKCTSIGGNSRAEDAGVSIGFGAVGENYCTVIGESANSDSIFSIAIGTSSDANGESAVVVGGGGTVAERGVALGRSTNAGKFAVALGNQAVAPEKHFVVASGSAQASVMLSGVFGSHLSLPNGQQFRQIASAAQTTDLMQWQNSAGTNVAAMTPSGILNVNQIVASGLNDGNGNYPGLHTRGIWIGPTKTDGWYSDANTFWAANKNWGWYNGGSKSYQAKAVYSNNNDRIEFWAGGSIAMSLSMNSNREFSINTAGWPVPTRIAGDTNDNLLYVDGADDKVAIGSSDPTYLLDVMGHGAMVRATGVIVGNSGVVLASNTPSVTTNTLYNAGGSLYFNGSAVGGGGAAPASGSIYEVQYNGDGTNLGADSDFTWNPSTNVMSVNGHISASTKSFLINHPTKPDKKLQYACLEGPENGVYVRGHTNDNLIDLPDYWTALVDPESITVQLTAKDAPQPFLYVSGVLNNQVHLISDREISAYYTVSATRKDVDPLLVEPDNY